MDAPPPVTEGKDLSLSGTPLPLPHIRSCDLCRHRKVKCDRRQPCSHCIRAGRAPDCVYPSGPGRAPKRPRRVLDAQLADRLSRLETMIRQIGNGNHKTTPGSPSISSTPPIASTVASEKANAYQLKESTSTIVSSSPPSPRSSNDEHFGRLMIDETRSQYVSNILWESLATEVRAVDQLLYQKLKNFSWLMR